MTHYIKRVKTFLFGAGQGGADSRSCPAIPDKTSSKSPPPTDAEWIPLSRDNSEGVWIEKISDLEKIKFLRSLRHSSLSALRWASIIKNWKGFYTNTGKVIPFSVRNCQMIYQSSPSFFEETLFRKLYEGTKKNYFSPEEIISSGLQKYWSKDLVVLRNQYIDDIRLGRTEKLPAALACAHYEGVPVEQYLETHKNDFNIMLACCEASVSYMASVGRMVSWRILERLFIVARKQRQYDVERWTCEMLVLLCKLHDNVHDRFGLEDARYLEHRVCNMARQRLARLEKLTREL